MDIMRWHIAIHVEGRDDDWEGWVTAPNVRTAVSLAIDEVMLKPGELVHNIHVSPPKEI